MEVNLQKPRTLVRTINSILLSWENIFHDRNKNTQFILEMENFLREWRIVYWGFKQTVLIQDLKPCDYYNFRLKYCNENQHSNWMYFKSATDSIPYFVIHFTRAVKFNKIPVFRKIISRKPILLETENKQGKTPLIQAIESQNIQMITFLITMGANVNTDTLLTSRSPLMIALFHNNLQILNLLVDKGANIYAKDCNMLTGLHYAVDSNILQNVKFCQNHGFDLNARDNKGWTPLIRSVILECSNDIILFLLNNGADITIKDNYGFDFNFYLKLCNRYEAIRDALPLNLDRKEPTKTF